MSDRSVDLTPVVYKEDIAVSGSGTIVIGQPCIVWFMAPSVETTGTVVLNISDDATGYTAAHRIGKIVFSGPDTEGQSFGKGLTCTRGLSVISNLASVDLMVIYE